MVFVFGCSTMLFKRVCAVVPFIEIFSLRICSLSMSNLTFTNVSLARISGTSTKTIPFPLPSIPEALKFVVTFTPPRNSTSALYRFHRSLAVALHFIPFPFDSSVILYESVKLLKVNCTCLPASSLSPLKSSRIRFISGSYFAT